MDIFVSYSINDEKLAESVVDHISRVGLTYFLAPKSIRVGDAWEDRVREALQACRCLLVLLSPNSIKSEWVTTEWGAAWALNKWIVPVLFGCSYRRIPRRLSSLQACNFDDLEAVVGQIASILSSSSAPGTGLSSSRAPEQTILGAEDLQPAFEELCREAEEQLRLFLHVLGPPKITDDLAEEIAGRVAARQKKPRPLRFSPVLALNLDSTPEWFWPMFDQRDEIYARHGILPLTASRFLHAPKPTGIDVVISDEASVMFMVTTVDGAAGTQTGILLRNSPSLANEYAVWFDRMIWANSVTRKDARAGDKHRGAKQRSVSRRRTQGRSKPGR